MASLALVYLKLAVDATSVRFTGETTECGCPDIGWGELKLKLKLNKV